MKTNLPSFEHFTRCVWTILAMLFLHSLASMRENLSSDFQTKHGSKQLAELHCMCGSRNELEGRIEKSVPMIAVWHQEACQVMTNDDPEGRNFLSYPHASNGFFFLPTSVFIFYLFWNKLFLFIYLFWNKLTEVPEYDKMQFEFYLLSLEKCYTQVVLVDGKQV